MAPAGGRHSREFAVSGRNSRFSDQWGGKTRRTGPSRHPFIPHASAGSYARLKNSLSLPVRSVSSCNTLNREPHNETGSARV